MKIELKNAPSVTFKCCKCSRSSLKHYKRCPNIIFMAKIRRQSLIKFDDRDRRGERNAVAIYQEIPI